MAKSLYCVQSDGGILLGGAFNTSTAHLGQLRGAAQVLLAR